MASSCANLCSRIRPRPRWLPSPAAKTGKIPWRASQATTDLSLPGVGKLRFSTFKGLKTRVFSLKSTAAAFPVSFRHQIWNRKQYYNRRKCYFRIGNSSKHFKSRQKNSILVSLRSSFQNVWRAPPYFLHRISASRAFPNDRLLESWTKKIKRSLIEPLFNQTLKVKFSWVRLRVNVWLTKPGIENWIKQLSLLCVAWKTTATRVPGSELIQFRCIIFYIYLLGVGKSGFAISLSGC